VEKTDLVHAHQRSLAAKDQQLELAASQREALEARLGEASKLREQDKAAR